MKGNDLPPLTMSVPEWGKRAYGLGRNASYEAANRGEFPVVKVGSKKRVPIRVAVRALVSDITEIDAVLARLSRGEAA